MKILLTGPKGLAGSAILENGIKRGHDMVPIPRECDLRDPAVANNICLLHKDADAIIHAAARVGGIYRNMHYSGELFRDNILINTNVIESARINNIPNVIAFGSNCAFPGELETLEESKLHDSPPASFHYVYAYTKRMVDIQIHAYNKQFGTNYMTVIPGNVFGEHDNYDLTLGHVMPSLIRKCYEAQRDNKPFVVWGTGEPTREFIYSHDLARAVLDITEKKINNDILPELLLIPGEGEYRISHMANLVAKIYGYKNIVFDSSKPNGQMFRRSNRTLFDSILPDFKYTDMKEALTKSIEWFQDSMLRGTEIRL